MNRPINPVMIEGPPLSEPSGILLVDKEKKLSSFDLVRMLRRTLHIRKIGHAGTLDPFATGVMVMLIGKKCTKLSEQFLSQDKEYLANIHLGIETNTYDSEGSIIASSSTRPTLNEIESAIMQFQGTIWQTPPMFSAKKIQGKKLYELARKGIEIDRAQCQVTVYAELMHYSFPDLHIRIRCSKGTYIRSYAYDLGKHLKCGAHLKELKRIRCGNFSIEQCISSQDLSNRDKVFNHMKTPCILAQI